jgi:hypothetical protein
MQIAVPPRSRAPYNLALDDDERRLICSLREIPPSPLRDAMSDVIEALVAFAADPGCPELQADGVPCTDVHMACDRCRRVLSLFDEMRVRFPPVPRRAAP